jgi:hypothetical protein
MVMGFILISERALECSPEKRALQEVKKDELHGITDISIEI